MYIYVYIYVYIIVFFEFIYIWENVEEPLQVVLKDVPLDWHEVLEYSYPFDIDNYAHQNSDINPSLHPPTRFSLFKESSTTYKLVWTAHRIDFT